MKIFLKDCRILIDNSATERAIRPFTVGRVNSHIMDTVHGTVASAIVYSLVETAKANELNIYKYLKHLLTDIPKHEYSARDCAPRPLELSTHSGGIEQSHRWR